MKDSITIINFDGLVCAILVISGMEEYYVNGEDVDVMPWDYDLINDVNNKCSEVIRNPNHEKAYKPWDRSWYSCTNFFKANRKRGIGKYRMTTIKGSK